jgi:hypothetical protein
MMGTYSPETCREKKETYFFFFFFFFFLGPVCISSGSTSAFKAYCAQETY